MFVHLVLLNYNYVYVITCNISNIKSYTLYSMYIYLKMCFNCSWALYTDALNCIENYWINNIRNNKKDFKKVNVPYHVYIYCFIISNLNLSRETKCEKKLFFFNLWILYYQNGNIFICDSFRYSRVALYIFVPHP